MKDFHLYIERESARAFPAHLEIVNGRRDNVIIPATGLDDFRKIVDEMVKAAAEIPGKEH